LLEMVEGLRIAVALPLLVAKIPLVSIAVIAAIAVLVYEVRDFFGRPAADASLFTEGDLTPTHEPERRPARAGAPTAPAARALAAAVPASVPPLPAVAPPVAAPERLPEPVVAPAPVERAPAAPSSPLTPAPARELSPSSGSGRAGALDTRLMLALAVAVGLAMLWIVARSASKRSGD
jgi:hypothetical protein